MDASVHTASQGGTRYHKKREQLSVKFKIRNSDDGLSSTCATSVKPSKSLKSGRLHGLHALLHHLGHFGKIEN